MMSVRDKAWEIMMGFIMKYYVYPVRIVEEGWLEDGVGRILVAGDWDYILAVVEEMIKIIDEVGKNKNLTYKGMVN